MFYNGFTLLMQLLAGVTAYWIGRHYGYQRGGIDMYKRCMKSNTETRDFFAEVSKKYSVK
jgi:hypothetical protein